MDCKNRKWKRLEKETSMDNRWDIENAPDDPDECFEYYRSGASRQPDHPSRRRRYDWGAQYNNLNMLRREGDKLTGYKDRWMDTSKI